jgi:hypothetical protein
MAGASTTTLNDGAHLDEPPVEEIPTFHKSLGVVVLSRQARGRLRCPSIIATTASILREVVQ